jgi:hypothetical protein
METANKALEEAQLTPEEVERIYYLTALAGSEGPGRDAHH